MTVIRHLSLALGLALCSAAPVSAQAADPGGTASFTVLIGGSRVGSQTVTLTRTAGGWTISSFGRLEAPFNLVTTKFELSYASDWQPRELVIEGAIGGQSLALTTTFGLTTATSEVVQNGQRSSNTQQITPRTVVLPDNFFGAYEALAARLATTGTGARVPLYRAPEGEAAATVDRITPRRIVSPEGSIAIREFALTVSTPRGSYPLEVWTDERQRLARVALPISSVVVLRDDISSVMTREEHVSNPGDESVFIAANGFSLGGTITKPTGLERPPVVILAAGPGSPGRDRVTHGVPVFGQLAGRLADAGYFVVRYDGRGTGQSGGRTENAGLMAYADDVVGVVSWLRRRRDVDADRIAVVGYGDSGPIAMLAARREGRIRGLALLASSGRPGHEAVLDQQQRLLSRLSISEADRTARVAAQARINDAVMTGRGWETIAADIRRQADTPWFKSWLEFDPAETLDRLRKPLLIVHGALDTEIPPDNADRLDTIARATRNGPGAMTTKAVVPGINHLLVAATTGQPDEYVTLESRVVSPLVGDALVGWLKTVLDQTR